MWEREPDETCKLDVRGSSRGRTPDGRVAPARTLTVLRRARAEAADSERRDAYFVLAHPFVRIGLDLLCLSFIFGRIVLALFALRCQRWDSDTLR